MEHARQWFVDLSRFMMGGSEAGCERGESQGGREAMGAMRASFQCRILKGWKPLDGWGGPSTVVLLFELIVFYFSTLLCVSLFCRLLRRASLPSH